LENVTYIDSSGLGTLLNAYQIARSQGASLKLAALEPKLKQVLGGIMGQLSALDVFHSEAEALQFFVKEARS
jgi:anti-anti-sigma factor